MAYMYIHFLGVGVTGIFFSHRNSESDFFPQLVAESIWPLIVILRQWSSRLWTPASP